MQDNHTAFAWLTSRAKRLTGISGPLRPFVTLCQPTTDYTEAQA